MSESYFKEKDNLSAYFIYTDYFVLKSSKEVFKGYISFCKIQDLQQVSLFETFLHHDEQKYFKTLRYERRIKSFLLGRYVAKKAVSALTGEENLNRILIRNGIFDHPVVVCKECENVQISITHCDDLGAAVAFPDTLLVGIDIEVIDTKQNKIVETQLTPYEKGLRHKLPYSYDCFLAAVWTVKESLSKAIKTGLTVPINILEVKDIEFRDGYFVSHFSNFPQYCSISFMVESYMVSITYPKNTEITGDIHRIKENIRAMFSKGVEGIV